MTDPVQAIQLNLLAGAILAVGTGLPLLILYRYQRKPPLFPPPAKRTVPWNGLAVLLAFVAAGFLIPALVQLGLQASGFFEALYGPDFARQMDAAQQSEPSIKQAANLRGLWLQAIAIPIQMTIIILGVRFATGATLPQMGLTRDRTATNLFVGYLGWLALAPLTYAVFMSAIALLAPNPQKHPLLDIGNYTGMREWIVFGIQAVVLAPFNEELLFRGLLLPWLLLESKSPANERELIVRPHQRTDICIIVAAVLCLLTKGSKESVAKQQWDHLPKELAPFYFLLALLPLYWFLPSCERFRRWCRIDSPVAMRGWIASSILFAAVHANVWPTPIPLFVLALGLGWLAIRTRSIMPSIVAHALFNAVSVVYFCVGGKV
jgi:membrane protease YdiL (CAAX protease family)